MFEAPNGCGGNMVSSDGCRDRSVIMVSEAPSLGRAVYIDYVSIKPLFAETKKSKSR